MIRIVLIAMLALAISGCERAQPESTTTTTYGTQVAKLFTVDDCTVYRFMDDGRFRYFTNCHGSTSWTESCGKNCTSHQGVSGGAP